MKTSFFFSIMLFRLECTSNYFNYLNATLFLNDISNQTSKNEDEESQPSSPIPISSPPFYHNSIGDRTIHRRPQITNNPNHVCDKQLEHDLTIFVHYFVLMMKSISDQMRTSGFGVAISGSGPDTNYGLVQCYGDLSVLDCVLCYAETRTVLPRCFPFTGGRIYLDGCFMQAQNCSLIEEYTGPSDYASCGNETERTPRSRSLRGRL